MSLLNYDNVIVESEGKEEMFGLTSLNPPNTLSELISMSREGPLKNGLFLCKKSKRR